jgi:hypothetical protein
LGNIARNLIQITLNEAGEFQPHYLMGWLHWAGLRPTPAFSFWYEVVRAGFPRLRLIITALSWV